MSKDNPAILSYGGGMDARASYSNLTLKDLLAIAAVMSGGVLCNDAYDMADKMLEKRNKDSECSGQSS
ncbi:MAG: hypothetical protein ACYTAF_14715 [Planctomycetota bacterium]|jgi:hypothetical protein